MDGRAAQRLPEYRSLVQSIEGGKTLASQQIGSLREGLQSNDPVLTSIAAWCISKMGPEGDALRPLLNSIKTGDDSMTRAFLTLAETSGELRSASLADKIRRYTALAAESNPYLKVEAAKLLLKFDRKKGKEVLARQTRDNESVTRVSASRALRAVQMADGETPVLPMPSGDELYETVLSVIAGPGSR